MEQAGARMGVAIKVYALVLIAFGALGCTRGKNPEGTYELETLDVQIQDPVHGYLELKKDGVLWAHWLIPESVIQVLSGYQETPAEKRHQTKGSAEHFLGSWQSSSDGVALTVAGKGPTCKLTADKLVCASGNGTKQIYRPLAGGKGLPDWAKAGKPVELGKGKERAKPFGEWNQGALLSARIQAEKGTSTHALRADLALKDKQGPGALFSPKRLRLQIAYPLLGEWPVATMSFENDVTCDSIKSEQELSRSPVAFVRGRPSVQVERVDLEFGCERCSPCNKQVEAQTLSFVFPR
jgi:hypothetical protein